MSGLHKTLKKAKPKELLHMKMSRKVDDAMIDATQSLSPKVPSGSDEPVIPLPDEEEIRRSKRRGTAARGGGRASTVLTGGNQDRLGG